VNVTPPVPWATLKPMPWTVSLLPIGPSFGDKLTIRGPSWTSVDGTMSAKTRFKEVSANAGVTLPFSWCLLDRDDRIYKAILCESRHTSYVNFLR
jgi:hypothetical protein